MFVTENFLLETESGIRLYHEFACDLPIIDYHTHLPPQQIAEDHRFENMTQLWLAGDHYKWRAMRANGIAERYCTGDASDWEKFEKWAETVPKLLRNPLYHWTHMELKRPFGIADRLFGPETARWVWDYCNALLGQPEFSCRGLLRQMKVVLLCTTDDPVDSLEFHARLAAEDGFDIQVLPTFRADRALAIEVPASWNDYLDRLGGVAGACIRSFEDLVEALRRRHDYFHARGCRISDHGLDRMYAEPYLPSELDSIFRRARNGNLVSAEEAAKFKSALLYELAVMDWQRGWVQQFHVGALRNVNSRAFERLGPDTGFDSIADGELARPLARFFDRLEREGKLTKTIVYNLNPAANEVIATMLGNFQDGSVPGKMQYGAAWWFLDQKAGIERQLETLSNLGLLSRFVGMLTDSRSFLSYVRHDYFRRILCNLLGKEMDSGLLPKDFELVGGMVRDICYNNAAEYFGFKVSRWDEVRTG